MEICTFVPRSVLQQAKRLGVVARLSRIVDQCMAQSNHKIYKIVSWVT
jgi:hypothetical protein